MTNVSIGASSCGRSFGFVISDQRLSQCRSIADPIRTPSPLMPRYSNDVSKTCPADMWFAGCNLKALQDKRASFKRQIISTSGESMRYLSLAIAWVCASFLLRQAPSLRRLTGYRRSDGDRVGLKPFKNASLERFETWLAEKQPWS